MNNCYFVSDLHGHISRYLKLFERIQAEGPAAVFIGGDLLPNGLDWQPRSGSAPSDFILDFLVVEFSKLQMILQRSYPSVFVIPGNDDGRWLESSFVEAASRSIWQYIPNDKVEWGERLVYGYPYVPPTPFQLKDWDRYDVSRYVDHGCVSPEDGIYSVPVPDRDKRYATIRDDLERLTGSQQLDRAIFLFHTPPYQTALDRLSGNPRVVDHAPLDVHAGSVAVRRFIENRQPCITLHGHIHESVSITGSWRECIGRTHAFSAAHDGPELALIRFSPDRPEDATRELI